MSRFRVPLPREGFTLIELVVVVGILGLMAAVSVPWLVKYARRNQLRSAAAEIQSSLLATRLRAVRRNLPATLVIVASGATQSDHLLETIEAVPPAPTPTPLPIQVFHIAGNVFSFVTLPPGNKITFDGNGRRLAPPAPTPSSIVVEGPVGATVTNQITIQTSLTGRIEVITPAVWQ